MRKLILIMIAMLTTIAIGECYNYDALESITEDTLTESELAGINFPSVSISEDDVKIGYRSSSIDDISVAGDIGAIVGIYATIVQDHPEVGDLEITIKNMTDGSKIARITCSKEWVKNFDSNLKDPNEILNLTFKVIKTTIFY